VCPTNLLSLEEQEGLKTPKKNPARVTCNTCCVSAPGCLQNPPESLTVSQCNHQERLAGLILCACLQILKCDVEVPFDSFQHQNCKQSGLHRAPLQQVTRTLRETILTIWGEISEPCHNLLLSVIFCRFCVFIILMKRLICMSFCPNITSPFREPAQ